MRRSAGSVVVLCALALVAGLCGCGGSGGPKGLGPSDSAAAREELVSGFDFLPPLGEAVTGSVTLNTQAAPQVAVFEGSEAARTETDVPVAQFSGTDIIVEDDHFAVEWDTAAASGGLPAELTECVIEVSWDGALLGYVDCQIDRNNGQGKKAADPDFFGLKDGRVLPIKFSIAESVVGVIGSGGGIATSADGAVTLDIPSGALGEATAISVEPTSRMNPATGWCLERRTSSVRMARSSRPQWS